MSKNEELKKAAEAVTGMDYPWEHTVRGGRLGKTSTEYALLAHPSNVLALLAEIGRLKQENRLLTEHNEFLASSDSRLAPELRAVKDALGLDFTASVSGKVVPLIERLRKLPTCWTEVLEQSEANDQLLDQVLELSADADRYRFLCDKFGVTELPCALERILDGDLYVADGKPSIDSVIDAARRKEAK